MAGDRPRQLRLTGDEDPVWRLWRALPEFWRGPVIGPGIQGWENITENIDYKLNLTGLPELIQAEMAWMAHWQATDGTRASVLALSQLANVLRRAIRDDHLFPPSIRQMDWETASALQTWFYTTRWGRFPSKGVRARLRVVFGFARTALIAACHDGYWWELDYWHPRCDPRIPLSEREPMAHYGCSPTLITHRWLREAVKWCLGTMLEAGTLRWTTVSQERLRCLHRFDRWLQVAFDNPLDVLGDPAAAAGQAAAFRRWDADPANRSDHTKQRRIVAKVAARQLNDDVRAVGELFEFMAANSGEARRVLGSLAEPWVRVTATHAASWFRQVSRIPHERLLDDEHYVDDQALGQITAALPLLGLSKDRQMPIIRSDGETVTATGMNDPQAMRMILLQILTARRSSEIRLCDFDCLSAPLIAPSRPPRARRSPVPATPKAKSTSHPTPSSSTPKSWRSSKNSSAGSANGSPMSGRRSCSSSCWATGPASSPTHRGPTTGGCASSAIWCGSPTARDASSNSAIPTGSGTPS
ncbi:hypothetical protein [Saccharopolyspora hattusasensis]|uniref:hypothetical protein n=1 Tax=Saccharopolyspora hattusasensis TaxID=1128679 RepID=UPI003D97D0CB